MRQAWLERAHRLGELIEVRIGDSPVRARFAGLDRDGALLLDTPGGRRRITAGEVAFGAGARNASELKLRDAGPDLVVLRACIEAAEERDHHHLSPPRGRSRGDGRQGSSQAAARVRNCRPATISIARSGCGARRISPSISCSLPIGSAR